MLLLHRTGILHKSYLHKAFQPPRRLCCFGSVSVSWYIQSQTCNELRSSTGVCCPSLLLAGLGKVLAVQLVRRHVLEQEQASGALLEAAAALEARRRQPRLQLLEPESLQRFGTIICGPVQLRRAAAAAL